MENNKNTLLQMTDPEAIRNKIYTIRGVQVMLDSDLAKMYQVETRVLNQAVKRNQERFPEDFCFQLTSSEDIILKSQIVMSCETQWEAPEGFRCQSSSRNEMPFELCFLFLRRFIWKTAETD